MLCICAPQGSAAAPSARRGAADAARLRLKAAIKAAWSREAVSRGVAAAKKADYALAHRRASPPAQPRRSGRGEGGAGGARACCACCGEFGT